MRYLTIDTERSLQIHVEFDEDGDIVEVVRTVPPGEGDRGKNLEWAPCKWELEDRGDS